MDLFSRFSRGDGYFLNKKNGVVKGSTDNNSFSITVYGGGISPSECKSSVFPCRNVLSGIAGYYAGLDRKISRASHLSDAINCLTDYLPCSSNLDCVVIECITFDKDNISEFKELLENFYNLVTRMMKNEFNSHRDIVIYCYLDNLDIINDIEFKGCSHMIAKNNGLILFPSNLDFSI